MSKILPFNWELPDDILERLGDDAGHQRVMDEENHLLLVTHQVPNPEEELRRDPVFFWRSPEGKWRGSNPGVGINTLFSHIDSYLSTVTALDDLCDNASQASSFRHILNNGVPLRRAANHLAMVLREARQARPGDRDLILARDKAVSLERACDLLVEDARNGLEYLIAHRAESQAAASENLARSSQRLNLLAALFLPLTTIASIFGMNLPSGIEGLAGAGFWAVISLGILVGIITFRAVSRPGSGKSSPPLPPPTNNTSH